jgi:tetrahydromethanopterin S-methyltransferase subunit C
MPLQRPQAATLAEPRRHLQVVAAARQVGKTTLVQQVVTIRPCGWCVSLRSRSPTAWIYGYVQYWSLSTPSGATVSAS